MTQDFTRNELGAKMKTTLVILKPDCVLRGLVGQVTQRLENTGLRMTACKMVTMSTESLKEHYSHLADKPFFPEIVSYMQSAPVCIQLWQGEEAPALVRKIVGATDSFEAAPGTIRGDFAKIIGENIIHASEDDAAAAVEIKRFFSADEIASY